jgi:hypothetical protein
VREGLSVRYANCRTDVSRATIDGDAQRDRRANRHGAPSNANSGSSCHAHSNGDASGHTASSNEDRTRGCCYDIECFGYYDSECLGCPGTHVWPSADLLAQHG